MAREYARVKVNIWADLDFRDLSVDAQHLYFLLLTSPTLNLAGVADWRPARIAALARGWTKGDVSAAGEELQHARFVVIDEDTEEVLVRSFVRHDGVLKGPKTAVGMSKDYASTASARIMRAIANEVKRASEEEPELKGLNVVQKVADDAMAEVSDTPSDTPSPEDAPSIPIPQPSTLNRQPRRTASATRIDPDFVVTDELREWAKEKNLDYLDLDAITEHFVDYWLGKSGKDGAKADWVATWRNWIRREATNVRPMHRAPLPERPSTNIARLPKCPTCNAPQEVIHYDDCTDQAWRPTA